jgi:protein-histidine pros-kinase
MTAHAMKGDRERCLQAGMDDYVSKPLRTAELHAAIERLGALALNRSEPTGAPQVGPREKGVAAVDQKEGSIEVPTTIFDEAAALARVGGDRDLLKFQVDLFLSEERRYLNGLREAVASMDCQSLQRAAHTIKGQVGAFSRSAMEAAHRVEVLAKDENVVNVKDALAALIGEMERLNPVLTAWSSAVADRSGCR